ncbi:hypothetical protein HYH02_014677 [Chlamydomonas schloesseri]|uniref:J domain-containing protein n=1 Tax=Chlamydomonas schloesseri TaxID=2026947 RepID=A0A835VVU6_9CHLO|nr:hypothetical protein HYH02_014677 [Chlamydomonas schloesseri]|eukprot:KAG2427031.1 hypothetical protein HYH02_014677 [Chlamydomonas schloesseri]
MLVSGRAPAAPQWKSSRPAPVPRSRIATVRVSCYAYAAGQGPPSKSYYEVLGIKTEASARDVKEAFRRLALVWHPDHCKDPGAMDKFMELKTAYDTLVDSNARAQYDRHLMWQQAAWQTAGRPTPGYATSGGPVRRTTSVRRSPSSSSRAANQQQPQAANSPPRSGSAGSGDDYDSVFGTAAAAASASGATGYNSIFAETAAAAPSGQTVRRSSSVRSRSGGNKGRTASSLRYSTSASVRASAPRQSPHVQQQQQYWQPATASNSSSVRSADDYINAAASSCLNFASASAHASPATATANGPAAGSPRQPFSPPHDESAMAWSASSSVTTSYGGDDFVPQTPRAAPAAPAAAQASAPAAAAAAAPAPPPPSPTPAPPPAPSSRQQQPQAPPRASTPPAAAAPSLESMAAAASTVAAAVTTRVATAAAAAAVPQQKRQASTAVAAPRPQPRAFTLFSFFPAFLGLINMLLNDGFVDVLLASGRTM